MVQGIKEKTEQWLASHKSEVMACDTVMSVECRVIELIEAGAAEISALDWWLTDDERTNCIAPRDIIEGWLIQHYAMPVADYYE